MMRLTIKDSFWWESGHRIPAIRYLREHNSRLGIREARAALDREYHDLLFGPCPDCEALREELARLGHPCAPGEPLVEKIRNLCAIIQSQRELLDDATRRAVEVAAEVRKLARGEEEK